MAGKVYHMSKAASSKYELNTHDRVLSLIKWGGNARFLRIHPEKLVKIPEGIDPAQAVCLPESYLTAFQTLHHGQNGSMRYKDCSLKGKSILIVGAMTNNVGKALVELALHGGAANICATAKKKHWKHLISCGVMPLAQDPTEWIMRLEQTFDLVLAANSGQREDVNTNHVRALNPTGHLILCGKRLTGNDVPVGEWHSKPNSVMCVKNKSFVKLMNRTHAYDVYEEWERDLTSCKQDLAHLLTLLLRGAIKPNVLDRIPLSRVPRAHELLESKRLSGFLVCEPWMRGKKRAVYL